MSVAGVARRQNRRAAYGYGAGVVGAGISAAAIGTAAAVATAPAWGTGPYYNRPYVGSGALAANAYYGRPVEQTPFYVHKAYYANGPWYGYSGWTDYKARAGIVCDPGTMIKGPDGLMHVCQ